MHVYMFPGQSSIDPHMMARALRINPSGTRTLRSASDILGRDLASQFSGPQGAEFSSNRDVQISVFLTTHIHLEALNDRGVTSDFSLGLSLGEFNHLVHIGALPFTEALQLVDQRGQLYDAGPRGCMISVFPVELEAVTWAIACARTLGVVEISNFNTPTQHVLAGDEAAVLMAAQLLEDEHSARAVMIERNIPMHCSRFSDVAELFRLHLESAPWSPTRLAYLPNITGIPIARPCSQDFVRCLTAHVHRPVQWRSSIEHLAQIHPEAVFVEVGPRNVLYNMLSRRWLKVARQRTDDEQDPLATFEGAVESLRNAA
jgi:[acyl-carrier-protein] S-malonyltransferase